MAAVGRLVDPVAREAAREHLRHGLTSQAAVSCDLPNAAVLYPLSRSISANGATELGRCPVWPGNAVAVSVTEPILFIWWLRPLRSAARVGEQRAVVWNWL